MRSDVTSIDMIFFCVQITRRMPEVPGWDTIARRQASLFVDGLAATDASPAPNGPPAIEDIRQGFPGYWT